MKARQMRETFYVIPENPRKRTVDYVIVQNDREVFLTSSRDDAMRARERMGQRSGVRLLAVQVDGCILEAIPWRFGAVPRFMRWNSWRIVRSAPQ